MPERKLIVRMGERKNGAMTPVTVEFEGDYIVKKELDLIIKMIKIEHKKIIRNYRRKLIIADYEAKKNAEKGKVVEDGTNGSGSEESTDGRSADSGSERQPDKSGTVQPSDDNTADAVSASDKGHAAEAGVTGESDGGSKISPSILAAIAKSKGQ